MTTPAGPRPVDVRAPRFVGCFTFVIAVVVLLLSLLEPVAETIAARATSPALLLLAVLWVSFGAGAVFGNGAHPFAAVFRVLIRPRLGPADVEDPRPPRFALLVGFVLTTVAIVLQLAGVPFGLTIATTFVVIASFLQAFAGFCLGCQVYLALIRAGLIRTKAPIAT